jgi:hypothetical protein
MLITLTLMFFISVSVLALRQRLGRRGWILLGTAAVAFSTLFAFISVSSVWKPQMSFIELYGALGGAKIFSFPLSLTMTNVPLMSIYPPESFPFAIKLTVTFPSLTILKATCYYSVYYPELVTKIDRIDFPIFNSEDALYGFLIAVFTFFNFIGAVLGMELARLAVAKFSIVKTTYSSIASAP